MPARPPRSIQRHAQGASVHHALRAARRPARRRRRARGRLPPTALPPSPPCARSTTGAAASSSESLRRHRASPALSRAGRSTPFRRWSRTGLTGEQFVGAAAQGGAGRRRAGGRLRRVRQVPRPLLVRDGHAPSCRRRSARIARLCGKNRGKTRNAGQTRLTKSRPNAV